MFEAAILLHWAEFAVRWLHVITAIAWIGSSFYFIALDLGLHRDRNLASGADGEEWQVHGGGFYHVQKYLVAPAQMPSGLVWFKWESYWTWISGFMLLVVVYYLGGEIYLIDPGKWDVAVWQGAAVSMASLALGWVVYNGLCRVFVDRDPTVLMVALFGVIVAMAWFYDQVFTDRAALLHLGAFTASIMTGNVFFVIMPNQRIVVADLIAGRKPDAKYGKIAKQRSTHNNYLTLPVIFLMLSNHYPMAFASQWNWVIAALVFLMGVTIRHWFNMGHARKGKPYWALGATAVIFVVIMRLSLVGAEEPVEQVSVLTPVGEVYAAAAGFDEVADLVMGNCSMCHGAYPGWGNIVMAPKGVLLDTPEAIANHAAAVYLQAGVSHAMPPPVADFLAAEDRALIRAWFEGAGS
jgi:uncharacterized membrane protein